MQAPESTGFASPSTPVLADSLLCSLLKDRKEIEVADINVRKIDEVTHHRLKEMAKSQKRSLAEVVRNILNQYTMAPELKQQEDKYSNLVDTMVTVIDMNTKVLNMVKLKLSEDTHE